VREASAHFFGFLGERLAGTEDIRSSGATGYVMRQFYGLLRGWLPLQRKAGLAGYTMWMTTLLLFTAGNAMAFGLGAYLYQAGAITIGTVYIIFYYTELLRQPIEQIRTQLQELQKASASIERVEELFHIRSRISDGAGTPIPGGALAVELDHVSFEYYDRPLSVVSGQLPSPTNNGQRTTDSSPVNGCSTTYRSRSRRAACWAYSAAPEAAKPRWRGCCYGYTTRPPARSGSAACRLLPRGWANCGGAWAWSRRTYNCSMRASATT
jgi:ABC-type multidrug transport system fused ATPase/permease subunit